MRYLSVLALLAACSGTQDAAPAGQEVALPGGNQEITLAIGEVRQLPGGSSLALTAVPDDARCPRNVVCVWEGSIAATLRLTAGSADTTATISSHGEPRAFTFRGWRVALRGASPEPDAGVPIPAESYRVTVVVSRE
jgi:hypothetical protein